MIKNEPCSDKVDVWSFGVVLWEILTCEIPYKDMESTAILYWVGNNSFQLPIPESMPEGVKLLLKQCWSAKPRNRPSFKHILVHLEILKSELEPLAEAEYIDLQRSWQREINTIMETQRGSKHVMPNAVGKTSFPPRGISIRKTSMNFTSEEELIRRRKDELRHAQDVREMYEQKLSRANNLYSELNQCMMQLQQREREMLRKEQQFYNLLCSYGLKKSNRVRHRVMRPILLRAGEKLISGKPFASKYHYNTNNFGDPLE